jgi:hypothetical protein
MSVLDTCLSCECLGFILVPELLLELVAPKTLESIVEGTFEFAGHYKLSVY